MLSYSYTPKIDLNKHLKDDDKEQSLTAINKAFDTCTNVLKNAYSTHGINAGETHFSDVWIRDSSYASWGALELNDTTIVKKFLEYSLDNMKYTGQCPLRIGQKYFLLKFLGIKGPQGPTYIEDKYISLPMDSNSLIIITCALYLKKHPIYHSSIPNMQKLKKPWAGHFHLKNKLVIEGPYAGWADSIKKTGHVLYTNVLYYQALKSMQFMASSLNKTNDQTILKTKQNIVQKELKKKFWNGKYFNDWVTNNHTQTTLSLEANMFAILFEITTKKEAESILDYIIKNNIITPNGCPVVDKPYQRKHIYSPFIPLGLKDYHNGLIWFWISCIATVVFHTMDTIKNPLNYLI